MALDLPTLVQKIRTVVDTKGADEAEASLNKVGGAMQKVGIGMTAGLTVPLVAFGATAVNAASDLNESISKVNVVFDESADVVQNWAKTSATSLGISRQGALEAAGTFGNLFSAMGVIPAESAKLSTNLVNLAADLASFNNANPDDVLLALRSGLLGEAEPLRQFGVQLSAARIESEALSSGIVKADVDMVKLTTTTIAVEKAQAAAAKALKEHGAGSIEYRDAVAKVEAAEAKLAEVTAGKVPELTAAQKAQASYAIIMKDTALAQGDFARTSDGLANQQRVLSAQFTNMQAALGQALLPAVTSIVSAFNGLLSAFLALPDGAQKIIAVIGVLVAVMGPLLIIGGTVVKNLNLLTEAFQAGGAINSFASNIGKAASAVGNFAVATAKAAVEVVANAARMIASWIATAASAVASAAATAAAWLVAAAPFIALGLVIAGVVYVIVRNWDTIKEATAAAWDFITGITTAAWDAVYGVISNVVGQIIDVVTQTFDTMKTIVTVALDIVVHVIQVALALAFLPFLALYVLIRENWDTIVAATMAAVDLMLSIVQTTFGLIRDAVELYVNIWRTIIETTLAAIQAVFEVFASVVTAIWDTLFAVVSTIVRTELAIIQAVIETAMAVVTAIFEAAKNLIVNIWNALFAAVQPIVSAISGFVTSTFEAMWSVVTSVFEAGKDLVLNVLNVFLYLTSVVVDAVVGVFTRMVDGVRAGLGLVAGVVDETRDRVVGAFDAIRDGIINAISGAIDWVSNNIGRLTGPIGTAIDKVKGLYDSTLGKIPGLAEGGRLHAGQLTLVGERGPELVIAGSNSTVVPNDQITSALRGGGGGGSGGSSVVYGDTNVSITLEDVKLGSQDDVRALSRELYALIDSAQRSKGTKIPVGTR